MKFYLLLTLFVVLGIVLIYFLPKHIQKYGFYVIIAVVVILAIVYGIKFFIDLWNLF